MQAANPATQQSRMVRHATGTSALELRLLVMQPAGICMPDRAIRTGLESWLYTEKDDEMTTADLCFHSPARISMTSVSVTHTIFSVRPAGRPFILPMCHRIVIRIRPRMSGCARRCAALADWPVAGFPVCCT